MKYLSTYFLFLIFASFANNANGQGVVSFPAEVPTPVEHALHGYATAMSGNWAIATSPQRDVEGVLNVGGATFYRKTESGWVIDQEALPDDATPLSNFGISADIHGNTAVFGAMLNTESGLFSGSVYVFTFQDTAWVQTAKLVALDAKAGDRFGHSVAISGNTIVVGAFNASGNEPKSGAAYIFEYLNSGWQQTAKLFAEHGEAHDYFGHTIDVLTTNDETIVAIGAYNATGANDRSGAVYTYSKLNGEWNQTEEIFELTGSSADLFGYSVSFGCNNSVNDITKSSGSSCSNLVNAKLFIGAPGTINENGQTGSVYYFEDLSNGVGTMNHLEEKNSSNRDHFGTDITFLYGELFVSASRTNTNNAYHIGHVYNYKLSENASILNSFSSENEAPFGYFGTSISSFFPDLIISAPYETVNGKENAGAVYFYNYPMVSNEGEQQSVTEYKLEENYPNPFNPVTTIKYQIKEPGNVRLTIYNVLGRKVTTLVDELKNAGVYQAVFDASGFASGIYFYQLEVNNFSSYKSMLLVK